MVLKKVFLTGTCKVFKHKNNCNLLQNGDEGEMGYR